MCAVLAQDCATVEGFRSPTLWRQHTPTMPLLDSPDALLGEIQEEAAFWFVKGSIDKGSLNYKGSIDKGSFVNGKGSTVNDTFLIDLTCADVDVDGDFDILNVSRQIGL